MITKRVRLGLGLALICVGVYLGVFAVIVGDMTDLSFWGFVTLGFCGVITFAVGLTLAVVNAW